MVLIVHRQLVADIIEGIGVKVVPVIGEGSFGLRHKRVHVDLTLFVVHHPEVGQHRDGAYRSVGNERSTRQLRTLGLTECL